MGRSKFRILKVIVQFPDKDDTFYNKTEYTEEFVPSPQSIISDRYPDRAIEVKRFYVKDKSGSEFELKNDKDFRLFLDEEYIFEAILHVELPEPPPEKTAGNVTPPKRVRVEKQQATPSTSAKLAPTTHDEDKEEHSGVVCDCCDSPIFGFRYKCTECFNFDLCMSCEGKMRHREHIMLRIPSPTLSLYPRPKDLRRRWKKHLDTAPTTDNHQSSHRHQHHGKRHQRRGQRPENLFDGFFRQLNDDSPASDTENGQTEQPQPTPTPPPSTNQPMPQPAYDFHKLVKVVEAVAGNVSKLFDPLGMSMDSYVDYGATVPPTTTPSTASPPPQTVLTPTKVAAEEKQKEAAATATTATPVKQNVEKEVVVIASPPVVPLPEPFIVDVVEDAADASSIILPTTEADPMSPSMSHHSDDAEWMVISNEGLPEMSLDQDKATQVSPRKESLASTSAQTSAAPSTETSAQTQCYEELARSLQRDIEQQMRVNSSTTGTQASVEAAPPAPLAPVVFHPVPHINHSVIKMMDMGFSNDGGCLTELMACCNGDIRRALDTLLYKK